ncbi:GNAT family N-acetyltransferase [Nocardioides sp. MAHUQ-72]|uniref:GNAT family N-acetyltransferase n=1 Tax=unclassified Nocardioides TaxID=2615069 RepID=UPI003619A1E8
MDVRSLGFRTDLALLQLGGSGVEDRGTHLVVRTPDNPSFYWGNFVLLASPPEPGSAGHWLDVFERELPEARHRSFGVDGTTGTTDDLAAFADLGFSTEAASVMTAHDVLQPPHRHPTATIRPLEGDADWTQQVSLTMAGEDEHMTEQFATRRAAAQRRNTEAGHGVWFGAFLDGWLASSMGVFTAADGLARYQEVKTHHRARGQGLCGTLVHATGRHALDRMGAHTLVMVADPDYLAIRVYRALGFDDTETQLQAMRTPDP